jgi:hypothetical protein
MPNGRIDFRVGAALPSRIDGGLSTIGRSVTRLFSKHCRSSTNVCKGAYSLTAIASFPNREEILTAGRDRRADLSGASIWLKE